MNSGTRWGVVLVISAVLILAGYRVYHRKVTENRITSATTVKQQDKKALAVFTTHPERRAISETITLTADIQPINQAAIYAQVSGYLESIRVRRGYRVKKGETLATIKDTTYRAQLQQATATRDYTCLNAKRYKKLLAKNLVSKDSYDLAREQCDQARAAVDYAAQQLAYTRITAPFDGYIFNRMVDPGATIPASTAAVASNQNPLFTVVDTHVVKIIISVPEGDVRYLHVGVPVQVMVDAFPGEIFPGKITRMNPALDVQTRTLAVEIDMPNPKGLLKPGMFAKSILHLRSVSDAIILPKDAVLHSNGHSYVFRVDPGNLLRKAPVITGIEGRSHVQIEKGVDVNDLVVIPGQLHLSEGETVSPKPYVPVFSPGASS
ncbi:MAG: efflux RND transporter periplasmic adaptor subunit [Nitrospirae bacterium]|jgi:membrane fusion protein (multidrug efflux system)|nr:efflux RND transporter periplasmic adaptor subunit [Nitrospirota bacterium]